LETDLIKSNTRTVSVITCLLKPNLIYRKVNLFVKYQSVIAAIINIGAIRFKKNPAKAEDGTN